MYIALPLNETLSCQPEIFRKRFIKLQQVKKSHIRRKPQSIFHLIHGGPAAKTSLTSALQDTWWIASRNLLLLPNCWTVIPQIPQNSSIREYSPGRYTALMGRLQCNPNGPHPDGSLNYTEYGNASRTELMDSRYIFFWQWRNGWLKDWS